MNLIDINLNITDDLYGTNFFFHSQIIHLASLVF